MPWVSWYWHVGIVIDIDDDWVLVESMNYKWRYIVSRDRIDSAQISSYIY
jgi:surface antigen